MSIPASWVHHQHQELIAEVEAYSNASIRRSLDSLDEFVIGGLPGKCKCRIGDASIDLDTNINFEHVFLLQYYVLRYSASLSLRSRNDVPTLSPAFGV